MPAAWATYGPVILVTVVAGIPLAVIWVVLLTSRRIARGWDPGWARRASVAEAMIVLGTLPWLWMILTPRPGAGSVSLRPLQDLADVLAGGDTTVQVIGNLLVFAALGFFLPIRLRLSRPALVPLAVAAIAAVLSLTVEVLQLTLDLGRVTSVDDVLLNTLGAVLACLASMRSWRSRRGIAG